MTTRRLAVPVVMGALATCAALLGCSSADTEGGRESTAITSARMQSLTPVTTTPVATSTRPPIALACTVESASCASVMHDLDPSFAGWIVRRSGATCPDVTIASPAGKYVGTLGETWLAAMRAIYKQENWQPDNEFFFETLVHNLLPTDSAETDGFLDGSIPFCVYDAFTPSSAAVTEASGLAKEPSIGSAFCSVAASHVVHAYCLPSAEPPPPPPDGGIVPYRGASGCPKCFAKYKTLEAEP